MLSPEFDVHTLHKRPRRQYLGTSTIKSRAGYEVAKVHIYLLEIHELRDLDVLASYAYPTAHNMARPSTGQGKAASRAPRAFSVAALAYAMTSLLFTVLLA